MRKPIVALFLLAGCKVEATGPHAGHYTFERDVPSDARQCPNATKEPENEANPEQSGYINGATATLDASVVEGDDHVNVVTAFTLEAQDSGGYTYTQDECPIADGKFTCELDPFQGYYSIKVERKTYNIFADLTLALAAEWKTDTTIQLLAIETILGCSEGEDPDNCKVLEDFVAQDSILDDNGDPQPAEMPCTNARAYLGTWEPPDTAAVE